MSILNGFIKTKKYRKTADGYKLESRWASSQTVEMYDGSTLEEKIKDLSQKISDTKDSIVTYTSNDVADANATSWTSVSTLTSGLDHATFLQRVSQMFKNVRYLYKMLGTTNISAIGGGTVTGAISSLNSNLSVIGTVYTVSPASYVSCNNGNSTLICSLNNLPAGTYVVTGNLLWGNTVRGGYREVTIRNGNYFNSKLITGLCLEDNDTIDQLLSCGSIIKLVTKSSITMWARQGSGYNLSVDSGAELTAVRIA